MTIVVAESVSAFVADAPEGSPDAKEITGHQFRDEEKNLVLTNS